MENKVENVSWKVVYSAAARPGGSQHVSLQSQGDPKFLGFCFLQMNAQDGGLNCCGLGTIGGFNMWFPHSNMLQRYPTLRMPSKNEMMQFVETLSALLYHEVIGVLGPSQQSPQTMELLDIVLGGYVGIHETTNKNYDEDRKPLLLIKANRDHMRDKWLSGSAGKDAYEAWLKKYNLYKE